MTVRNPNPWYVCLMLAGLYMFANIDRFIINLMVESIKRDFVLSDTQVSLLIGITFSLFYVLCGIPIARYADRANRRNVLALGVTAWSLMTAGAGLAQNFWHLFLSRIGVGVGESTIAPCAHSMLTDTLPPEQLGRGFAVYSMGAVLGGAFAFAIGGILLGWTARSFPDGVMIPLVGQIYGWQLVFIIVGLPGVLMALLFYLTVREPDRQTVADTRAKMPLGEVFQFYGQHKRVFFSIYAGIAIIQIAAGGVTAWLPALYERRFDIMPDEAAPYLIASIIVPGLLSSIAAGWVSDRLLKKRIFDSHLRVSAIAMMIGTIPFGLATLASSPIVMSLLFGFGYFFVFMQAIICPAALQLISPPRMRSMSASFVMVATFLIGAGSGPTVVALITDLGFGDESKVYLSVAIVSFTCATLSGLAFAYGRRAFGQLMEATQGSPSSS